MKNYSQEGDSRMSPMKRLLLCGLVLAALPALSFGQGVKVEYAHLDGIGNVVAVSSSAGAEIESHDYLPFGEEWCGTAVCGSVKAGQLRRFTGKERDAETGLDYFGARYFTPKMGRFTTVDPVYTWRDNLVDPQRWNRYAYVRNNPLKFVDPDGRFIAPAVAVLLGLFIVLNNPSNTNVTTGPTASTIVPNSLGLSAAGGLAAGGIRSMTREVVEELSGVPSPGDWAKLSGTLRQAARGKGNFGVGSATSEQAEAMGRAWVGEGAALAKDGKTLISQDGLRQFRPPSFKPKQERWQANLEGRDKPSGQWQSNAHVDIVDKQK